jgi:hypothetical protein
MSAAGAGTVLSGYPAWPVRGAASQRAGPAICWIRCLTMSRTTASARGVAAVNPDGSLGQLEGRQPVANRVDGLGTERVNASRLLK